MPIYMDRHDVSEAVTAEIVAQIHQEDLKVQHKFGCRGLTYWFDDVRKTAFCLIEAPSKDAIIKMHDLAHGEVPHQVIEVETSIVESFLGRIEDPVKAKDTKLNIINDPAFRVIMVVSVSNLSNKRAEIIAFNLKLQQINKQIFVIIKSFDGNVVKQNEAEYLISFQSVVNAVTCAQNLQQNFKTVKQEYQLESTEMKIGLHAGVPVTHKSSLFEDTIKLALYMQHVACAEIVISTEVNDLYKSENTVSSLKWNQIFVLNSTDEDFMRRLMEFIESNWQLASLKVKNIEQNMRVSKSKLYREMIRLTGKSPSNFLFHYRLQKALHRLKKQTDNISEIAFDSGFSSPSYFAKCFKNQFGFKPSEILDFIHPKNLSSGFT